MTVEITLNDGTVITPKEVPDLISAMERRLITYDSIIKELTKLHSDAVNHSFQLAKEIDILTEVTFQNPNTRPNEHTV